jgi:transmembrane sensor
VTPTSKRIQQEATHWAIRRQLGPLAPEDEAHLRDWLESDPRHKGAYIRANLVRVNIERISALAGGAVPDASEPRGFFQRLERLRRPLVFAGAAVVLTLLGFVGHYAYTARGDSYTSGIGELRQVALEDGSSMLLNTSTRARVQLSPEVRDVRLAEGEALFEVAKDPTRPFVVHAGDVTVRAIGTAFAVRTDDARIDVTVTDGVVELTRNDGSAAERVSAGHHVALRRAQPPQIEALNSRETERRLAWRSGRLEFDGQQLSEAVEEINRHNRRHIVVADARLAQHPIVGSFRAIDALAFANIAAAALGAEVAEDGDTIRIEPKR